MGLTIAVEMRLQDNLCALIAGQMTRADGVVAGCGALRSHGDDPDSQHSVFPAKPLLAQSTH